LPNTREEKIALLSFHFHTLDLEVATVLGSTVGKYLFECVRARVYVYVTLEIEVIPSTSTEGM
jgi:hypothetical protein